MREPTALLFTDTLIGDMLKAQEGRVTLTSAVTGIKEMKNRKNILSKYRRRTLDRRYEDGKTPQQVLTDSD